MLKYFQNLKLRNNFENQMIKYFWDKIDKIFFGDQNDEIFLIINRLLYLINRLANLSVCLLVNKL